MDGKMSPSVSANNCFDWPERPGWTAGCALIQIPPPAVSLILMPTYLGDLHFAWRAVIRKPVLSFVAVVTLALGIGLTSAVFALVHGVLLTPPPYPHAERIVCVS